ncbi:unnamed protein product [Didymodactylos carnosus]|uniref:EGF-like domain-containing protein n=1 Tax=Didymodactylos carnosus TaxID=1234261 RepID=A0A815MRE6_9BILA|nr:unnamed protein product [Didymodactylos carnosus]CAF1425007.1 unnamed protein product [Didymodactylos carnosus]CAF4077216.1 unnamed protein product [Didymodactylos carnosus]CAF4306074.1 unnamed protein product [Didymodactylos carnosus]
MKAISKYRVHDSLEDCHFYTADDLTIVLDEDVNKFLKFPCPPFNLTRNSRFKCATTDQCVPRSFIGGQKSFCADKSDKFYFGNCKQSLDFGCQFLRDLAYPPVYFIFQENCNDFHKLPFNVNNETDETNCEEWPIVYKQQYQRCNGVWDQSNGEDELNCPNTTVTFIRKKILKCNESEHYCARIDQHGQMGCLPVNKAGDEVTDCLGATDERTTKCIDEEEKPFYCYIDKYSGMCMKFLLDLSLSCAKAKWALVYSSRCIFCDKIRRLFEASWLYNLTFRFLPVSRLALHLTLKDVHECNTVLRPCGSHGHCRKYLNPPNNAYCQCKQGWTGEHCNITSTCLQSKCANGGRCVSGYSNHVNICICPLGKIGPDCCAQFDPCKQVQCQNRGTCIPLDDRSSYQFICLCQHGYYGTLCEFISASVEIRFSNNLQGLLRVIIFHFVALQQGTPGVLFVQNRFMYKNVLLERQMHIFNHGQQFLPAFLVVQVFFDLNRFDYYLAMVNPQEQQNHLHTKIVQSNRCPYVNELLKNDSEPIQKYPSMKKIKYYHRACKLKSTKCFVDEAHICFCNKHRSPDCLVFLHEPTNCTTDYCQNDGHCVQSQHNGIWDFGCVCTGCSYGALCQLKTSQYVLSLDAMLGADLLEDVPLILQPRLIKITLTVVVLMFILGFVSNALSLITFWQPKTREFGCGLYLFCLPVVGQSALLIFGGRFFYLLATQLNVVDDLKVALWSCIGLEYFLGVCPALFDWLTACVATERSINIVKGAQFKKKVSVKWAKRVILMIAVLVCASSWHEPFIRQLTDDPRSSAHAWCIVKFRWSWLKYYRLIVSQNRGGGC